MRIVAGSTCLAVRVALDLDLRHVIRPPGDLLVALDAELARIAGCRQDCRSREGCCAGERRHIHCLSHDRVTDLALDDFVYAGGPSLVLFGVGGRISSGTEVRRMSPRDILNRRGTIMSIHPE